MTQRCRVLFADTSSRPDWGSQPNRFTESAREAAQAGFEVTVATMGARASPKIGAEPGALKEIRIGLPPYPLVCGRGRAPETRPLRDAYALAQAVCLDDYDVVIAPLRGGLAHGLLMQRATGERTAATRIALWCDAPSRWRALRDDASPATIKPLVADAMENVTLELVDALLYPSDAALARLAAPPPAVVVRADLATPSISRQPESTQPIGEIVFVGPLTRANGALLFMDAIEELAAQCRLGNRLVTFIGPMVDQAPLLSQETVGVRAQTWPFAFRMLPASEPDRIVEYLAEGRRLAVFAAEDDDDDRLLREAVGAGCPVLASRGYDLTREGDGVGCAPGVASFADAIASHCDGAGPWLDEPQANTAWGAVLETVAGIPRREPPRGRPAPLRTVSVCTVTRSRPETVLQALASIGDSTRQVEALVLDNAGSEPRATADLRRACAHPVELLRSERKRSPASAYNHLAAGARGEVLVFLDDDNVLSPGGLERFVSALEAGWFDLIVTTLDLVDGNAAAEPSAGRFIFLGDAGSAGLFFNGFGDRAMAIRRDAFLRLGGFPDPGHHAPVSDWVFLARARAAGLRIGVLQDPALRYARRLDGRETNWLKRDVEGGRRAVLEAYGDAIDGALVARFAQGLQLRSF